MESHNHKTIALNNSPVIRWTVLFIVATAMMMGYFVNDVMSPLETILELPRSEGGLGWSSADYGFFSGAGSFINVFLLMLFFSGIILDKMGIRFIRYAGLLADGGRNPHQVLWCNGTADG